MKAQALERDSETRVREIREAVSRALVLGRDLTEVADVEILRHLAPALISLKEAEEELSALAPRGPGP